MSRVINGIRRKLGLHVHEPKPTNHAATWYPPKESQYWTIERCDCGKEWEVLKALVPEDKL